MTCGRLGALHKDTVFGDESCEVAPGSGTLSLLAALFLGRLVLLGDTIIPVPLCPIPAAEGQGLSRSLKREGRKGHERSRQTRLKCRISHASGFVTQTSPITRRRAAADCSVVGPGEQDRRPVCAVGELRQTHVHTRVRTDTTHRHTDKRAQTDSHKHVNTDTGAGSNTDPRGCSHEHTRVSTDTQVRARRHRDAHENT